MAKDDVISLPHAPAEDALGMEVLLRRPSRPEDFEAENRALVALADELANHPRNLLQKLTELALSLCRAESAGVSILESDGKSFQWKACAGLLAKNLGTLMLRSASPCGVVIEHDSPILFEKPSGLFALPHYIEPPIVELLLVPFHEGRKPVGTVWLVAHSPERRFDREDVRLLKSLSRFASAAYQFTHSMDKSINMRDFLEKRVDERTRALSLANRALRGQILERQRIEKALQEAQDRLVERLQDAEQRKDELIAMLSHELRNPLAAIDSSAQLMQLPGLDGKQCEFAARVVQRQCATIKTLLDDLLDVSRLSLAAAQEASVQPPLPVPPASATPTAPLPSPPSSPARQPQSNPGSRVSSGKAKYRILVADDNTAAATAIAMLLERDGHETKAVHDGRSALAEAQRFLPDIALLDIGMPHLSGYEVARKIRASPWGVDMRLFAATGWGQEKDKMLAKEAGFDVHMTKPIDFKQLLWLIEEHGGK